MDIFWKEDIFTRYTQIFEKNFYWEFPFHFVFQDFLKFGLNGLYFGNQTL